MKESVPGSITVITGDRKSTPRLVQQFLDETIAAVQSIVDAKDRDFKVESGKATKEDFGHRSTTLKYKGQVVAMIKVTRTELNFVRCDFFRDLDGIQKKR